MSNKIKEIVSEIQFRLDLTQEQIAERIGYSRPYLTNAINKNAGGKILDSLIKEFGEILQNVSRETSNYIDKRRDYKNHHVKEPVPVYGGYSTLGNITVYDDERLKNEVIGTLPPNIFPNCDYAEKAKGDSMYPLIMNQALLVGKVCSAKGIVHGEKYIIKTKDGLDTTKFVHPVKDDNNRRVERKLLLVAHNKSIPPQEIDINDIVFSCRVHWIVNPT